MHLFFQHSITYIHNDYVNKHVLLEKRGMLKYKLITGSSRGMQHQQFSYSKLHSILFIVYYYIHCYIIIIDQ